MGECAEEPDETRGNFQYAGGSPAVWYYVPHTMQLPSGTDGRPRYLGYIEVYLHGVPQDPVKECSAGCFSSHEEAYIEAIMLGNRLLIEYPDKPADGIP